MALSPGGGQTRRRELTGQLSAPLRRFLATEAGSATLLVAATAVALAWANSRWSASYVALWETEISVQVGAAHLGMDLGHWIDDGLMAVFFFVIGLEVRRDLSVGELTDRTRVVLPVVAGVGGMVVPAALFLLVAGRAAPDAWGVVIGTDTAFLLGALALVGPACSTQLRVFLLTLTVVDDVIAVLVIGAVYSGEVAVPALAAAVGLLLALVALGRWGVWRTWPYVVVALALWVAVLGSGLHAALAGMAAGLLIPSHAPRRVEVEGAARRATAFRQSPLAELGRSAQAALARAVPVNERLQLVLHPWTGFVVVPLFALANAGVDLRGGALGAALGSAVTWGVVVGLVGGKLVGIGGATILGRRLGLGRLPEGVGSGHVLGGAALSGIGFTVSLLIAGLALADDAAHTAAVVGVLLAAVLATALGWLVFRLAATLRGETSAALPTTLSDPVDPTRDHVRGPVDAPLTLVEYGDFECPFCARATGVAREVRAHFGDDLRYVFRHLPLPDVHLHAETAAAAAEAAGRQGRFWEMHDVLFAHQDELDVVDLAGYAGALGLDVDRFAADLDSPEVGARIRADVAGAEASGARGTPTFFVAARRHTGPWDAQTLIAALEASREAGVRASEEGTRPADPETHEDGRQP